jgi:hypothetical protein
VWQRVKNILVTALVLALCGAVAVLWIRGNRGGTVRIRLDPPAIVREIQQLNEIVTVRYVVQKVIGLDEEKVPFGSESLLLLVRAEVLGGIDLAGLQAADVKIGADGGVTVRLPAARVLHAYIDEKETKVWDRHKTWWTPWVAYNPDLDQKARRLALESVQTAAIEMGLLETAQQNASRAIQQVLGIAGVTRLTVIPTPPAPRTVEPSN